MYVVSHEWRFTVLILGSFLVFRFSFSFTFYLLFIGPFGFYWVFIVICYDFCLSLFLCHHDMYVHVVSSG